MQRGTVMSALNDKVVIVTGDSSGIGRATALSFAGHGAKVLITGRRAAALDQAAADHPNICGLVADAALPEDAVRTIAEALDRWDRLDVLVNNAGAGAILPLADSTAERISEILAVNVLGPSLLAAAALPHLTMAKGTIINVSSTFGHRPVAGLSHYAASKAALEHLTRCWALELAPQGVRVNAVANTAAVIVPPYGPPMFFMSATTESSNLRYRFVSSGSCHTGSSVASELSLT
jgi:NAD(P)-dependent dehydrogenase (short-subunit alcohol dehydrogenase family)